MKKSHVRRNQKNYHERYYWVNKRKVERLFIPYRGARSWVCDCEEGFIYDFRFPQCPKCLKISPTEKLMKTLHRPVSPILTDAVF